MLYIFNPHHGEAPAQKAEDRNSYAKASSKPKPKDWAYMEASGKVLRDLPETWRKYTQDDKGRMDIIKMEYQELLNAKTDDEISRELVHLGSACLHYWRLINNAE